MVSALAAGDVPVRLDIPMALLLTLACGWVTGCNRPEAVIECLQKPQRFRASQQKQVC